MKKATAALVLALATLAHGGIVDSGSGAVSTDDTTAWASKINFQYSIWTGDFKTEGTTYGMTGTMALSGQTEDNHANVVFFGVMHDPSTATGVWNLDPDYSANMSISETSWNNNEYKVNSAGTELASALFPETRANVVYGYAMNLTYSPTSVDYEMGIDFDNDGTYDYITDGTSSVSADRLRLVFGVTKAMSAASASLANSYTYMLTDTAVVIPEPAALGLITLSMVTLLGLRRIFSL